MTQPNDIFISWQYYVVYIFDITKPFPYCCSKNGKSHFDWREKSNAQNN